MCLSAYATRGRARRQIPQLSSNALPNLTRNKTDPVNHDAVWLSRREACRSSLHWISPVQQSRRCFQLGPSITHSLEQGSMAGISPASGGKEHTLLRLTAKFQQNLRWARGVAAFSGARN